MRIARRCLVLGALFLDPGAQSLAQTPTCRVEPFQGATQPQGAIARIFVVNTGATCSIANYGVPAERTNPASSGSITLEPSHGSARFVAPEAKYTPATGYAGDDEFGYEAFAKGAAGQQVRLRVRVKVRVVAP